jgi:hemerythrin
LRTFKWSNDYLMSIPEIDADHRTMFRMGEELQVALAGGASLDKVKAGLEALVTHVSQHYTREEEMMEATRYLARGWHRQQHVFSMKKIAELKGRIDGGERAAAIELIKFLAVFLKDHLSLADRMLGSHLRNYQRAHAAMAS